MDRGGRGGGCALLGDPDISGTKNRLATLEQHSERGPTKPPKIPGSSPTLSNTLYIGVKQFAHTVSCETHPGLLNPPAAPPIYASMREPHVFIKSTGGEKPYSMLERWQLEWIADGRPMGLPGETHPASAEVGYSLDFRRWWARRCLQGS